MIEEERKAYTATTTTENEVTDVEGCDVQNLHIYQVLTTLSEFPVDIRRFLGTTYNDSSVVLALT